MKHINFKLLALVLVLSLVFFFGGSYLFDSYKINRALQEDLVAIDGVEGVTINKLDSEYKLTINLADVSNLQQVFLKIDERVKKSLTEEEYRLKFSSQGSSEFEKLYNKVNLALYEAIKTGEFVQLEDRLVDYKEGYNLKQAQVQIDTDHIYLSLAKGDQEIYKVINRVTRR
ncbi:hypothetical protein JCM16358_05600 [Halanaerocella petrolearia]